MNGLEHAELQRLIASLPPDDELGRLAAALTEAAEAERHALAEARAHLDRAAEVDRLLIAGASDAKGRAALVAERAALDVEASVAPRRVADLARRRALAELAYLARVAHLARAATLVARREHDAAFSAWAGPGRQLAQLESNTHAEHEPQRVALREQVPPLVAALRRHAEAHDRARELVALVRALAEMRYGGEVNLAQPPTWEPAAAEAGRRAARRLSTPLVAA